MVDIPMLCPTGQGAHQAAIIVLVSDLMYPSKADASHVNSCIIRMQALPLPHVVAQQPAVKM